MRLNICLFTAISILLVSCSSAPMKTKGRIPASPETRPDWAQISFVKVRAGTFKMGVPNGFQGRVEPEEHEQMVTLTKDFEIGTNVITQWQWLSLMGTNPSRFSKPQYCPESYLEQNGVGMCPDYPVEMVSWDNVQEFISKLNSRDNNYNYRMPTAAEWEYAARAGTQTRYSFGDDPGKLSDYAWYNKNSNNQTHAVASKKPNPWGLYDVHGNVRQWVQNWFDTHRSSSPQTDPTGPSRGGYREFRGGSWNDGASTVRPTHPDCGPNETGFTNVGARLVRTAK